MPTFLKAVLVHDGHYFCNVTSQNICLFNHHTFIILVDIYWNVSKICSNLFHRVAVVVHLE
jgi:hypothetical protein